MKCRRSSLRASRPGRLTSMPRRASNITEPKARSLVTGNIRATFAFRSTTKSCTGWRMIAELQTAIIRQPVHDFVVDRNANVARIFPVTQERALGSVMFDARRGIEVNLPGRDARSDERRHFIEDPAGDGAGRPHGFKIAFAFQNDLQFKAATVFANRSSGESAASTAASLPCCL